MMIGLCSPTMAQTHDVTLKIVETSDVHGVFFHTILSPDRPRVAQWQE